MLTDRPAVRHLVQSHYLHKWPGVVVLTVGLFDKWDAIGCIVFAMPPRETGLRYGGTCWELARLYIKDGTPKNSETWFLSRAIGMIRKERPEVKALVSYADPSAGHKGTIYKAGNWIADGRTDDEQKSPRCDYQDPDGKIYSRKSHVPEGIQVARVPRTSKYRFVYWLDGTHEERRQKAAA